MVLLSTLWLTTSTPLEQPEGRDAEWKVVEVVNSVGRLEDRCGPQHRRRPATTDPAEGRDHDPLVPRQRVRAGDRRPAGRRSARAAVRAVLRRRRDYLTDNPSQEPEDVRDRRRNPERLLARAEVRGGRVLHRRSSRTCRSAKPPATPECDASIARKVAVLVLRLRLDPAATGLLPDRLAHPLPAQPARPALVRDRRPGAARSAAAKLSPVRRREEPHASDPSHPHRPLRRAPALLLVLAAPPAGAVAPQPVDASEQGGSRSCCSP